jgi:hypothetical protein
MQNQESPDLDINFTHLPNLLAQLKVAVQDDTKPFDDLILQANEFNQLLLMTIRCANDRRKVSQGISNSFFIDHIATELFENIEKELQKLPDSEGKTFFEAHLNHLKTKEITSLKDDFEKAKRIMTTQERYELFKSNGIKMLNENYAEFHSPAQLGRVVTKFCESFKSEGFGGVSFDIQSPPLTQSEKEQIRDNTATMDGHKKNYLMAIFQNAAKCGYPPNSVEIKLDGKTYSHDDEMFKNDIKQFKEWEETANKRNDQLVEHVKEDIIGYRSPGP